MRPLLILLVMAFFALTTAAQDSTLSLSLTCWERPEPGAAGNMYIDVTYTGAPSSWGGSGRFWSYRLPEGELTAGVYPRAIVASVDGLYPENVIQLWTDNPYFYAEVAFSIDTSAPECADLDNETNRYGPDGGWNEITVFDPPCDPCRWAISDEFGNWHDIGVTTPAQDEGNGRFTRLVLGRDNPITDPARYQVRD